MTTTTHTTAGTRPAMSYRQAYDAGLPVAVPTTGKLPVRHSVLDHAPASVRFVAVVLWGTVRLAAACLVLLLLVAGLLWVLGVPA